MRKLVTEQVYPEGLRSTLLQALHPDPDARFSHAEEMADQLRELVPAAPRPPDLEKVVATLHGIRPHARWQRAFAEVATSAGLQCRLDRWNFGYFSVIRFLLPWARRGRVPWLRRTFQDEFGDSASSPIGQARPSIVAHSFGTYILGNALVRYPYLRFNKILLCGSILPTDFPWQDLIARGQVQSVRNEYGSRDIWTHLVKWFVPGTGPSGIVGFKGEHERLYQERFDFSHSEYFERSHMQEKWVPFLRRHLKFITPREREVELPRGARPWGLYALYLLLLVALSLSLWQLLA